MLALIVAWGILLIFGCIYLKYNDYDSEDVMDAIYKFELFFYITYLFLRFIALIIVAGEDKVIWKIELNKLLQTNNEFYITLGVITSIHIIIALIYLIVYLFKNTDVKGWVFISSFLILCGLLPVVIFANLLKGLTIIMGIVTLVSGTYYLYPYIHKIRLSFINNRINSRNNEISEFKAKQKHLDQLDKELKEMRGQINEQK
jgi:hypothetical protein